MESSAPRSIVTGWLQHRRAGGIVVAFGVLLALPSLSLGFFSDDYVMVDVLEHRFANIDLPWWDLYHFTHFRTGDRTQLRSLIAWGEYPWWTSPELKLHFARPIPGGLLALDHAIFGRSAVFWHLHSLIWYGALLVVVGALFRRLLPPATATLALLLFALSDATIMPAAWPSARHFLLVAVFSGLGLWLHVRWRRDGWRPGRPLALLSFVVALLCGEAALGGLALAVAHEFFGMPEEPRRVRVAGALPFVSMAVAYLGVYAAAGCGASGSAGYLSPLAEPIAYVVAAATRFPILLTDAIVGVPADTANLGIGRGLAVAGLVAAVLAGLLLRSALRRADATELSALRWLLPGAFVAMLGALGGFPGARELLIPNFGLSAALAVILRHGFAAGPEAMLRRAGAGFLAVAHLGFAALMQLGNEQSFKTMARATEAVAQDAVREIDAHRRLRILEASDPMVGVYTDAVIAAEGGGASCGAWIAGVHADMLVQRTGPRTFALAPKGTTFLRGAFETLYRAPGHPLSVGDELPICGALVRVVALDAGLPSRIEVTDDDDLDDPSASWLAWQGGSLRPFKFPPPGGTAEIAWTPGPMGLF